MSKTRPVTTVEGPSSKVRYTRRAFSAALRLCAAFHEQGFAEMETAGQFGQLAFAHQTGTQPGHAAFSFLGKALIDFIGDIHFQHGVAQKFQPFVVNGVVLVGP